MEAPGDAPSGGARSARGRLTGSDRGLDLGARRRRAHGGPRSRHSRRSVVGRDRDGQARRERAELRQRHRRDVRRRGRPGRARRAGAAIARCRPASFRVDVDLRPYGRAGPLVRSLESFEAYWDRWAEPWEFQALLKARSVAGDAELGAAFDESATARLWSRPFSADDLRALRGLKARSEEQLARSGLSDREVKRGRGGIRDIEFAVQLLQLVHGRLDPDLRSPTTLPRWRAGGRRLRRRGGRSSTCRRVPVPAPPRAPPAAPRRHGGLRLARRRDRPSPAGPHAGVPGRR